jgi:hypothetical protein
MITVDKFLINLLNTTPDVVVSLPHRDLKVLKSLAKIIISPIFITENQGNLLVKILKEHRSKLGENILEILETPSWSKPFRQIEKTRKLYLGTNLCGEPSIVIEFTFSSNIRKILAEYSKKISANILTTPGKHYYSDLTEKNIVGLVDLLKKYDFEIDGKIQDFYNTIKSWSENEVKNQFLLTSITHQNFQKTITNDLGLETSIDENIIADRSMRYQYFHEKSEKIPENLVETLAYRKTAKVWVDKKTVELDEIIEGLIKLKRLPVLVVFDQNDHPRCFEEIQKLSKSLEKNGIFQDVGIYFRLSNDDSGTQFNKFIADKQYNSALDAQTKIVGVQHGKIPKFFLKNDWKPMSVLAIGNSLRQTKTAVYANHCDLIISYTDAQPIIESRPQWE